MTTLMAMSAHSQILLRVVADGTEVLHDELDGASIPIAILKRLSNLTLRGVRFPGVSGEDSRVGFSR